MQKKKIIIGIICVIAFITVIILGVVGNSLSNQEKEEKQTAKYKEVLKKYEIVEKSAIKINEFVQEKNNKVSEYMRNKS